MLGGHVAVEGWEYRHAGDDDADELFGGAVGRQTVSIKRVRM